jgi:hypothetical protein
VTSWALLKEIPVAKILVKAIQDRTTRAKAIPEKDSQDKAIQDRNGRVRAIQDANAQVRATQTKTLRMTTKAILLRITPAERGNPAGSSGLHRWCTPAALLLPCPFIRHPIRERIANLAGRQQQKTGTLK